ncbi:MAG: ABC transporter substrate-binding protein [Clostridia bacterium]|nr:ABC transporter substrate-binding protein [Clostridia bacterium]
MKNRVLSILLAAVMIFALAACAKEPVNPDPVNPSPVEPVQPGKTDTPEPATPDAPVVQGVTADTIYIGNTAATSGAFAAVGIPFNAGLEAALKTYNDAGGYQGKTVKLVHYDDGFDAAQGLTYTKTLVEDDKVFALVGHFGTNTVGATLDYIKSTGVPMMYAATGISELYQEGASGKDACVFPVQPIYDAEGRVLLARALASAENGAGLGGTKIGVLATTDDAGAGLLAGVKRQAREGSFDILYQEVDPSATEYTAALTMLKNAGCDVVIACMNQAPFQTALVSMRDVNYNAKVITSYVSASAAFLNALVELGAVTEDRPVYATAWLDVTTEQGYNEMLAFAAEQLAWEAENGIAPADTYSINSYAMAGYVAGKLFLHGLQEVEAQGLELNWENYIAACEKTPFHIPMGGDIRYAGGDRLGVTALALNTVSLTVNETTGIRDLVEVSPILSLDDVWAQIH